VHGKGDDDCMGISAAEVMVSSDNLSPQHDRDEGALYARGGIFNTGIVFLKHTKVGLQLNPVDTRRVVLDVRFI
jgi:hypothetical protein